MAGEENARMNELIRRRGGAAPPPAEEPEPLETPAELESGWRENLNRLRRSAELLDEGGEAAAAHDRHRFIAVATEARKIELEMAAFAERVGFSVCGREV